jgi:hypothetical protein
MEQQPRHNVPVHEVGDRERWPLVLVLNMGGYCCSTQCRCLCQGLLLTQQLLLLLSRRLRLEGHDLPLVLDAERLELLLLGHRQHRLGIRIVSVMLPTAHLHRKQSAVSSITLNLSAALPATAASSSIQQGDHVDAQLL